MSTSTPWKTDKWHVSPWNYAEEVRKTLQFPKKIKIHDVTLRDGEQQAGITFRKEDKIRIAEKLAEVGVHRIEAGMPAVSKQDEEAVREIARRNLGPEIFAFARCMVEDVKRAVDCGVKGIVIELPSSQHIIQNAYRWPLQKAIDLSIEATLYAKEQGLYTVFFPIDCSRAEIDWVIDLVDGVAKHGHMDALAVVDTFGGTSPHAIPYLVRKFKERFNVPIEVHFHDDFGMGPANTILGLAAGAEVAHTTVTGTGERAGNAAYEDVVTALLTMYGIDLGLKYEKLYETSKLVQELSGIRVPANRGVIGDQLFHIESGIIASWWRNCGDTNPTQLFPIHWELVGNNPPQIVLGKNSGIDSIRIWLEKIGTEATEQQMMDILMLVKEKAYEKKGLLNEAEFREIVKRVVG